MIYKIILFIFLGVSLFTQSEILLLLTSIAYCVFYMKRDFWPFQVNRLDISSVYSIGLLLNTISHLIAITSTDPDVIRNYLLLYVPKHLFTGLAVFHIGSIVIMETFRYTIPIGKFDNQEIRRMLQKLRWDVVLISTAIFFLLDKFTTLGGLGSVGTIVRLFVMGSILYLSVYAHFTNEHKKIYLVLLVVSFVSLWALLFSYLRFEIVLPWVSYFLGEAIARKRLRDFTIQSKAMLVILLIIAPPVFTYLGDKRAEISGRSDKLSLIISGVRDDEQELERGQTIMARLSYINQLTHVIDLTTEKGFYNGRTLEYFGYVFIPRFLWSEKPTIQQGQWFALESGLAFQLKNGKVNNSINMTVPGEFYLNFGWLGVVVGCMLFALFISFIWRGIQGQNLLSLSLQFYLLFGSMAGLGADLQIVVTLFAYYLIYRAYLFLSTQLRGQANINAQNG